MISPDLFKIKPPREHIQYTLTDSVAPGVLKMVNNHLFNHSISVIFPDTMHAPSECKDILINDAEYYLLKSCPLYLLVEFQFIEAFVTKGDVTLVSVDTYLDVDKCCSITPSGYLVLSIHRNEILQLGIEKGPAVEIIHFKTSNRYLIIINLKHPCFKPNKSNYKRVVEQLSLSKMEMNIIVAWEPKDVKVCPSSLAYYFSKKRIECEECTPSFFERRSYNVSIPKFQCSANELFEWLGLYLLDALEMKSEEECEYLSSYQTPQVSESVGQVLVLQSTGLVTASRVSKLWDSIRNYLPIRSSIPWIGLHVKGFEDSPVTWSVEPHHHSVFGDNNFSLICDRNMSVKTCKVFTSFKCKD